MIFKFLQLFLFFTIFTLSLYGDVKYLDFIDEELKLVLISNDRNITESKASEIVKKQEDIYVQALSKIMTNKNSYIKDIRQYDSEIFSLKKVIAINKRAGNKFAVLRDEVQIKSYLLVKSQNIMLKNILLALDKESIEEFENSLNIIVAQNQEEISKINDKDYTKYLAINSQSRVIKQLKDNIKEYYALLEINGDIISFIYKYKSKMYRLNKYSKYHLIKFVVYMNSFDIIKLINPFLENIGLDVVKIVIILFVILFVYFFRKIVYVALEKWLIDIDFFNDYLELILGSVKKTISFLIIIININIVLYVYHDFSSVEMTTRIFNILYGIFFTLIVYKVVNIVASVKLSSFETNNTEVKKELINVGIKIINFFIVIMGILIALYFGGVDLTAVLSGLGIGGFAVAFAAKDTISNFFGTLSILFSDVFSQGDWIEIDNKEGVVVEIGLRVTTIRTFDNALIAIPNGTFASKDIKNWNKRKLGRRIKMKLGIKYNSKIEDINKAISQIRDMLKKHPDIATQNTKYEYKYNKRHIAKLVSTDDLEGVKKTLLVYLDEFSDSSINILVYCFSTSVDWEEWLRVKQDIMQKIMYIFEENSLEFAFPSLSIYNED